MQLRAGCAQTCITPDLGVSLAGYFHDRIARSVRDDLFARVVLLESDGVVLAIVSLDLAHVHRRVTEPAKAHIAERLGIPVQNIMICATHTHTGPEICEGEPVAPCEELVERLPTLICDTVEQAWETRFAAQLRPGRTEVHGYAFNRLFRTRQGGEVFGRHENDQVVGRAGGIDPELLMLGVFDERGQLRALVYNFALHVDVIGGGTADFISADWPGEVARNLGRLYGDDLVALLLQGAAGDINHVSHVPTSLPTGGPEKAVQLGRALAGAVVYAAERAEPIDDTRLAARQEVLSIPYFTRDEEFSRYMQSLKQCQDPGYFERYLISVADSWQHDGQTADVLVQVMCVGEMGLVALPAEIFYRIGRELKHYSPFERTLIVEQANDRSSVYIPPERQAQRGAYGTIPILSRWLSADAGRRVADAAIRMLHELYSIS